jgi:phospholipid/cholesterol/gamma-HCH transport system substrate-binding protein
VIRRTVRIQLIVFMVITVLGIGYAGFQYVGLGRSIVNKPFSITVQFPDATGVYVNAEVTERGVQIGKVTGMKLTPNGVNVKLAINHGYKNKIPKTGTKAVLANLSAVGEQFIDLQPQTDSEPFLSDGDVIDASATSVPLSSATLLSDIDKLVNSVNQKDLTVVIDELDKAFAGSGPDLARLINAGDSFTEAMQAALPQTIKLIDDGKVVLDTQRFSANDIASFSSNLAKLVHSIREDDPSYRALIDNGVASSQQLNSLLLDNESALTALAGNLATVSGIQAAPIRLNGLRYILTIYPSTVYDGFKPAPGDGKAHFAIDTDQSPPNCATDASSPTAPGYVPNATGGNQTNGFATTNQKGVKRDGSGNHPSTGNIPAKINAFCDTKSPSYTAGTDVRGAQNAPRPPGDTTARPPASPAFGPIGSDGSSNVDTKSGNGSSASAAAATPVTRATTTYDPFTGFFLAPGGQPYLLDTRQSLYYGSDSWKWLLISPTLG